MIILCLSPLGDTLFATPAIRALRENFPRARIVVLASPAAAEVLKLNPFKLELIIISDKWDLIKVLHAIRKDRFDLAVSLSLVGSLFTRFCATRYWSDFSLISIRENLSVVQMCTEILRMIGLNISTYKTEFWCMEKDQQIADLFLKGSGFISDRPLIAIHCGGHYFVRKRWPMVKFIEIINFLINEIDTQLVLVGGREDVENSLVIRSMVPNVISSVGLLKLAETAALLKRCHLFIGNDSGPLHLGAALDVPTIGLFGPTDPRQFYPYSSSNHSYIYKGLSCSPCYKFGGGLWQYVPRCSKAYCMEAISTRDLVERLRPKLVGINQHAKRWVYAGTT